MSVGLYPGSQRAHAQTVRYVGSDAELAERVLRAVDVKFESGATTVHPSMLRVLDTVADILERSPWMRIQIAGHADAAGGERANLRLSEARAEAVKLQLVARYGIDPERLMVVGYGEDMPIASNASQTGRALNRRVEFRIFRDDVRREGSDRPQVDADSLREEIRRQVTEAVASTMSAPDSLPELERELQERLDSLEQRLAEASEIEPAQPAEYVPALSSDRRTALLPFAGLYLRGDLPIVLGLRGDFGTTLPGLPRFQPELAFGFRPDDRATLFGANVVWPIVLDSRPDAAPFVGLGIGFHDLDRFESLLNLVVGVEYRTRIGVLFGELVTQDFFDYNRVAIGFRQEI